jgi:hypothetical protein
MPSMHSTIDTLTKENVHMYGELFASCYLSKS